MRFSFASFMLCALTLVAVAADNHGYVPADGFVPNKETAIRIAVAVWEPIYGVAEIAAQKPYQARLEKGMWYVEGTLGTELGGVAIAEISKSDGRILRVSHGR